MTAWGLNSEWIFVNASSTCGWNSEAWWYLGAGIWKLFGNERTGQMKEKWWLKIWRRLPVRRAHLRLFRTLERDIHGQILNQVQFQNLKIEENPQASDWKKISTSQQFRAWKQARISPVMPLLVLNAWRHQVNTFTFLRGGRLKSLHSIFTQIIIHQGGQKMIF